MSRTPDQYTPDTLIKRVMSGKKEYRTNDYLTAFSKLSSTDLHHSDYHRRDIITLWNSLQNTPNKVRYFTFSLTSNNGLVSKAVEEIYKNDKYAYICHDKDKSVEHKHYHYVLMFDSPRSFKSIANDLEIPVTMLQKVYSKKGILDYLTHENDPNKHHYSLDEIHANFDVENEKNDPNGLLTKEEILEEFYDYWALKEGRMSRADWLDKYWQKLCIVRHYGSRLKIADMLFQSTNSCTGASLSTRSEFRGRTSVSNPPIQSAFSEVFPNKVAHLGYSSDPSKPVTFGNPDYKAPKLRKKSYAKPNPRSDLNDIE